MTEKDTWLKIGHLFFFVKVSCFLLDHYYIITYWAYRGVYAYTIPVQNIEMPSNLLGTYNIFGTRLFKTWSSIIILYTVAIFSYFIQGKIRAERRLLCMQESILLVKVYPIISFKLMQS